MVADRLKRDLAAIHADANTVFAALGDLHVTGPTGTNAMDLVVGVAGAEPG